MCKGPEVEARRTGLRGGNSRVLGKLRCTVHRVGLWPTAEWASWKDAVQPGVCLRTCGLIAMPLAHVLLGAGIVLPCSVPGPAASPAPGAQGVPSKSSGNEQVSALLLGGR